MKLTPDTPKATRENPQPVHPEGLFLEGIYPFEVLSAEEKISSNGNPMIVLQLECSDPKKGITRKVRDNLVATAKFHVEAFCKATGIHAADELTADDCIGKTGEAKLIIHEYNGKQYNKVKFYSRPFDKDSMPKKRKEEVPAYQPKTHEDSGEEIPF